MNKNIYNKKFYHRKYLRLGHCIETYLLIICMKFPKNSHILSQDIANSLKNISSTQIL